MLPTVIEPLSSIFPSSRIPFSQSVDDVSDDVDVIEFDTETDE